MRARTIFAMLAAAVLAASTGHANGLDIILDDPDDPGDAQPAAAAARNVWPDEQFEQWVFQDNRVGAGGARNRFDALLKVEIEEIDRVCRLTEEQKKKLQLVGRGDIKHLYDGFEKVKRRFKQMNNDMNRLNEMMNDVSPLQSIVQAGVFEGSSLFARSLHHTLTAEQLAQYAVVVQARRAYRHRAQIELAVDQLEQTVPFREEQRRALIDLLVKETKPPRVATQYGMYLVYYRLGLMPDDKVKPLFTNIQWVVLKNQLAQYKGYASNLKQNGVMIDEDEPAEKK